MLPDSFNSNLETKTQKTATTSYTLLHFDVKLCNYMRKQVNIAQKPWAIKETKINKQPLSKAARPIQHPSVNGNTRHESIWSSVLLHLRYGSFQLSFLLRACYHSSQTFSVSRVTALQSFQPVSQFSQMIKSPTGYSLIQQRILALKVELTDNDDALTLGSARPKRHKKHNFGYL